MRRSRYGLGGGESLREVGCVGGEACIRGVPSDVVRVRVERWGVASQVQGVVGRRSVGRDGSVRGVHRVDGVGRVQCVRRVWSKSGGGGRQGVAAARASMSPPLLGGRVVLEPAGIATVGINAEVQSGCESLTRALCQLRSTPRLRPRSTGPADRGVVQAEAWSTGPVASRPRTDDFGLVM